MSPDTILFLIILIFSVVIHEVAHGYMADHLGDPTARLMGRLTLNPIPHIDLIGSIIVPLLIVVANPGFILGWAKPVPFNIFNLKKGRWGPALVAIAGPAANLILAFVFGLLIRFAGYSLAPEIIMVFGHIVLINLILAVFNLIPIPPLDGHHILFSMLPAGYAHVKDFLMRYSIIIFFFVIFFLWEFISPIVLYLFIAITGIPA